MRYRGHHCFAVSRTLLWTSLRQFPSLWTLSSSVKRLAALSIQRRTRCKAVCPLLVVSCKKGCGMNRCAALVSLQSPLRNESLRRVCSLQIGCCSPRRGASLGLYSDSKWTVALFVLAWRTQSDKEKQTRHCPGRGGIGQVGALPCACQAVSCLGPLRNDSLRSLIVPVRAA